MLNYYHKFLPNLCTVLAPLHKLLSKNVPWERSRDQEGAFNKSKEMLTSTAILTHYDSCKEIVVTCDASPYGIGAVISHVMENGDEKPIAYTSRTLSTAEKNYAQIDKEGLTVVYGVKKFHQMLYGRKFTIMTDHKPLLGLFSEHKCVPPLASGRIQRWALTLSAYEYVLKYRRG